LSREKQRSCERERERELERELERDRERRRQLERMGDGEKSWRRIIARFARVAKVDDN
jgi:hypothetical protein